MSLLAYSLTGSTVTLPINPPVSVPAEGFADVTSNLVGLPPSGFIALANQQPGTVGYYWTNGPEFPVFPLDVGATVATRTAPNTAIWAPFLDPLPPGMFANWADAVAAVNASQAPTTTLQIIGNPNTDTILIPGGTWVLNNTTIVGTVCGVDTDTDYRGWQELLLVTTAADPSNPTLIRGCAGLKNMWFRQQNFSDMSVGATNLSVTAYDSGNNLWTMTIPGGGYAFATRDIGKPVRVGNVTPYQSGNPADTSANNGTFKIVEVLSPTSFVCFPYDEHTGGVGGDANNGFIGWSLCTSVFIFDQGASTNPDFTLDNVDFRYGGDTNWGSLFITTNAGLFIHERNHSSIRWFSCILDGYLVVETDGSGCWVGSLAFCGTGYVDVFALSGTEVHTFQPAIAEWNLYQGYTVYLPGDTGNWNGSPPATVMEALDRVAAALVAAGHTP